MSRPDDDATAAARPARAAVDRAGATSIIRRPRSGGPTREGATTVLRLGPTAGTPVRREVRETGDDHTAVRGDRPDRATVWLRHGEARSGAAPVFVDGSGRRRALWRAVAAVVAVLGVAFVVVIAVAAMTRAPATPASPLSPAAPPVPVSAPALP